MGLNGWCLRSRSPMPAHRSPWRGSGHPSLSPAWPACQPLPHPATLPDCPHPRLHSHRMRAAQ